MLKANLAICGMSTPARPLFNTKAGRAGVPILQNRSGWELPGRRLSLPLLRWLGAHDQLQRRFRRSPSTRDTRRWLAERKFRLKSRRAISQHSTSPICPKTQMAMYTWKNKDVVQLQFLPKHAASSNCLTACGSTSIVTTVLQATVRLCLASNGTDCSCVSLGFSIGGLGHVIR